MQSLLELAPNDQIVCGQTFDSTRVVKKSCTFEDIKMFWQAMVVQQTSKTVYLAVVILQETKLRINKSGAFVHLKVCKKKEADICHC